MIPTLADVIRIGKEHGFVSVIRDEHPFFLHKPCYACDDNICMVDIVSDDKVRFPVYIMQKAKTLQFEPTYGRNISLADISVQWIADRFDELDADLNRIMHKYDQDSQTRALTDIITSQRTLETVLQ